MAATATVETAARSYVRPGLAVAALVLVAFAWFWFQPSAADEARLEFLEADPTLVLPTLAGETPELVESERTVATRDWTGSWGVTDRVDRYSLESRRVDRYAEDLFDHLQASPWELTSVRCQEDQLVLTGRQLVDGDWATIEVSAWATGPNGTLSVRSAIAAVGGTGLVVEPAAVELRLDCTAIG